MKTIEPGAKVWFVSKWGDTVTGTYKGIEEVPAASGPVQRHIVISRNAFGRLSKEPTHCIVTDEGLHQGEPPPTHFEL